LASNKIFSIQKSIRNILSTIAQNNRKFILKTSVIYGDRVNQSKQRFSGIDLERLYRNSQSDTNGVLTRAISRVKFYRAVINNNKRRDVDNNTFYNGVHRLCRR